MKQQVNLYQPILYPVRERFSLKQLLISWSVLVLLLAAAWFWLNLQQQHSAGQLSTQQQQLTLLQQELTLYQEALAQRKPATELVLQYRAAEHSVLQKQQLLNYVTQQQQLASQFYSPILQHLAQIDRQELWLTGFSLQQQYSSFNGIALRPDSVPLWLEDLRKLGYFRGQRFSQVKLLQVPGQKAVNFELVAQQGAEP
jgi:hypothetical protein